MPSKQQQIDAVIRRLLPTEREYWTAVGHQVMEYLGQLVGVERSRELHPALVAFVEAKTYRLEQYMDGTEARQELVDTFVRSVNVVKTT